MARERRDHFKNAINDSKSAYIAEFGEVINKD